ncbi:hypothetical protein F383_31445 [Gossypium arboreum]|uniref:Uncharacterized protein n=1 Tax=Gossypium arboreum TaxID=29729 RepID=A0A0B0MX76_GOSAR|nr:hypothetical protein F383_31445 [Gossypium arboreum]
MRLSQYARECVSTEAIISKSFEDGLNEDIRLLNPIGVASWLFKWTIFVHTGRDTSLCLSRVRHTAMLHGRVSPGVPYNYSTTA